MHLIFFSVSTQRTPHNEALLTGLNITTGYRSLTGFALFELWQVLPGNVHEMFGRNLLGDEVETGGQWLMPVLDKVAYLL